MSYIKKLRKDVIRAENPKRWGAPALELLEDARKNLEMLDQFNRQGCVWPGLGTSYEEIEDLRARIDGMERENHLYEAYNQYSGTKYKDCTGFSALRLIDEAEHHLKKSGKGWADIGVTEEHLEMLKNRCHFDAAAESLAHADNDENKGEEALKWLRMTEKNLKAAGAPWNALGISPNEIISKTIHHRIVAAKEKIKNAEDPQFWGWRAMIFLEGAVRHLVAADKLARTSSNPATRTLISQMMETIGSRLTDHNLLEAETCLRQAPFESSPVKAMEKLRLAAENLQDCGKDWRDIESFEGEARLLANAVYAMLPSAHDTPDEPMPKLLLPG